MITGFEKIIEERILKAQKKGAFDNLQGAGKPLNFENDAHIPEDLRLAYKILKNSDFTPPEIELRKEIITVEALLADMPEGAQKYRTLKRLNVLILKLNSSRQGKVAFEMPQRYSESLVRRLERE